MNGEIKETKKLLEAVNAGNWSEAKRLAKTCDTESAPEAFHCIREVLKKLYNVPQESLPSSANLEIIRILNDRGTYWDKFTKSTVDLFEAGVIRIRDWKYLESLIDDAPLASYNIGKLVSITENDLDNKDAIRIIDKHIKVHRGLYGVKYSRNKIIVKRMVKKILRKIL